MNCVRFRGGVASYLRLFSRRWSIYCGIEDGDMYICIYEGDYLYVQT